MTTWLGNGFSPGYRLWCLWWCLVLCCPFFATRCLEWDLGLSWASSWGFFLSALYVVKCSFVYKFDAPYGFSETMNRIEFTLRFQSLHGTKRCNFETMSSADNVGCKLIMLAVNLMDELAFYSCPSSHLREKSKYFAAPSIEVTILLTHIASVIWHMWAKRKWDTKRTTLAISISSPDSAPILVMILWQQIL